MFFLATQLKETVDATAGQFCHHHCSNIYSAVVIQDYVVSLVNIRVKDERFM